LLYASWVAAQLGWTPADAKKRIRLQAREDRDATSVGILSIALRSDRATFTIRKNYGELTGSAHVEMPDICGLPRKRAFWPTDDTSLLSQELDHSQRHTVYERAVVMATQILQV
jgi:hypothetical protein